MGSVVSMCLISPMQPGQRNKTLLSKSDELKIKPFDPHLYGCLRYRKFPLLWTIQSSSYFAWMIVYLYSEQVVFTFIGASLYLSFYSPNYTLQFLIHLWIGVGGGTYISIQILYLQVDSKHRYLQARIRWVLWFFCSIYSFSNSLIKKVYQDLLHAEICAKCWE